MEMVIKHLNEFFLEHYWNRHQMKLTGGQNRFQSGRFVEKLSREIFGKIAEMCNVSFEVKRGDQNGPGSVVIYSPNGFPLSVGLDNHFYINEKLVYIEECKSYCDRAMLLRASIDANGVKEVHPDVHSSVLCLENAVGKAAFSHYMDRGYINSFSKLMSSRRNYLQPIYKEEFGKDLNLDLLTRHLNIVHKVISGAK